MGNWSYLIRQFWVNFRLNSICNLRMANNWPLVFSYSYWLLLAHSNRICTNDMALGCSRQIEIKNYAGGVTLGPRSVISKGLRMNREQQIKLLILKGMIHRIEIAEDLQKIREIRQNRAPFVKGLYALSTELLNRKSLLFIVPALKGMMNKSKDSISLSRISVLLGIGTLVINLIKKSRTKHN